MARLLHDLAGSALLWLVIVLAIGVYNPLLGGTRWWVVGGLVIAGVLIVSRFLDLIRVPGIVQPLVLLWLWFFTMMLVFAPGTGIPGLVPTAATFEEIGTLVDLARNTIWEQQPPVRVDDGLTFILVASISVFTISADVLDARLRSPMAVGAVIATVMVVPGLVLEQMPNPGLMVAVAAAWVLLLHHRSGPFTWRRSAALGVAGPAAVAGMMLLVALLPSPDHRVFDPSGSSGPFFDGAVSPLINLGEDLRRPSPYRALTYTSDGPQYLRMLTISDFSGSTWGPDDPPSGASWVSGTVPRPSDDIEVLWGSEVTTRIRVEEMNSSFLPLPYPAVSVEGLQSNWRWDDRDGSAYSQGGSTEDEVYAVVSRPLEIQSDLVPRQGGRSPLDDRTTEVPSQLPELVASEARSAVAGATNDFDRAVALERYFLSGDFRYSEDAPAAGGYDGDGIEILEPFLTERAGYCVHYATAMATMARTQGIPARIAVGFLPGRLVERDADDRETYAVSSDQLHAWPELYIGGVGWVAFEPTPGRGAPVSDPPDTSPSPDDPSPTPTPDDPSPTPTPDDPSPEVTEEAQGAPGASDDSDTARIWGLPWFVPVGGISLLVLGGGLGPALWRIWRRRSRLRGAAPELWQEVIDTARDLGVPLEVHRTPRVIAAQLVSAGVPPDTVGRLRQAVEIDRYAPPERSARAYRSAAREAIEVLRQNATARERAAARVWPRTLFERAREPASVEE